jgi:hypothetical protein
VSFHPINRLNRNLIIDSNPWDPATANKKPVVGDWVSKKESDQTAPPEWVYQITDTTHANASTKEFKNSLALAESRLPAHMTSSSLLKGTSRSKCSLKKAMELRSGWPRTSLP